MFNAFWTQSEGIVTSDDDGKLQRRATSPESPIARFGQASDGPDSSQSLPRSPSSSRLGSTEKPVGAPSDRDSQKIPQHQAFFVSTELREGPRSYVLQSLPTSSIPPSVQHNGEEAPLDPRRARQRDLKLAAIGGLLGAVTLGCLLLVVSLYSKSHQPVGPASGASVEAPATGKPADSEPESRDAALQVAAPVASVPPSVPAVAEGSPSASSNASSAPATSAPSSQRSVRPRPRYGVLWNQ